MSTSQPTAYGELIRILEALPTLVLEKRRRNGLSLRTAAEQIPNVGPNTVFRVEKGCNAVFCGPGSGHESDCGWVET